MSSPYLKNLRTYFTRIGASLPAVNPLKHGQFIIKQASATEDELYNVLRDASGVLQNQRILTKTYGDTLYSAVGHDHDTDYAAIGHDHDDDYAAIGHDHDSEYLGVTGIGTGLYVVEDSVNSATTSSTTDTSNFSTNVSVDAVLPTGTWTIFAWGNGMYSHSVESSTIAHRIRIGSDGGTVISAAVNLNNTRTGLAASHTLTGQTGTVTVYLEYRVAVSGTAYAAGGSLFVIALRTA